MTQLKDPPKARAGGASAVVAAVLSSAIVLGVIAAAVWVIAYGLPSGEVANWWVLTGTLALLALAVVSFRFIDARRMSLLKKCLVVSVLLHVLIALLFSAVGVTRQVVHWVKHEPMTPTVNLQLSKEMEVRESVRQQVSSAPPPPPAIAEKPREQESSPLPAVTPNVSPVGKPEAPNPEQLSIAQNPIAPTITNAPVAPELTTPLLPVHPELTPLPESTPLPSPAVKGNEGTTHLPGPVEERLARATTPLPGVGEGSLGAPPASLRPGLGESKGTATGSGNGRPLAMLSGPLTPEPGARALDHVPVPVVPPVTPAQPGELMPQRTFQNRQRALEKYGGNAQTEAAVARALAFLSRTQNADGHWTKVMNLQKDVHGTDAHDTALTGLALLCFLAADNTPNHPGPYQVNVRKAVDYLLLREKPDGDLRGDGNMYDQGIASLAMGEAAAMSKDPRIIDGAHRAAQFIVDAQNRSGGWRYAPRDLFSDTSVLGWQVMALHSAARTGFQIPDQTRRKALEYLSSVSTGKQGMLAGYLTAIPTGTMTAEATFARLLLGQPLDQAKMGEVADYLNGKLPSRDEINFYYMYYGSLALMQLQGPAWRQWNSWTSQTLLGLQKQAGAAKGSWSPESDWGPRGGRVYTTALATLTLEVYYRYLPQGQ